MPLRVFISHSTDKTDAAAREFLRQLAARISSAGGGMEVLVDQLSLFVGDRWRPSINAWMGGCHAAVLLVSKRAVQQSTYVPYEASVLAFRHAQEGSGFKLIPVLLDVTAKELETSPLRPCQVGEIQDARGRNPDEIIDKVIQVLLAIQERETPGDRYLRSLTECLENVDDSVVSQAGAFVKKDNEQIDSWSPGASVRAKVARRLMEVGLNDAGLKALRVIVPALKDPERREAIVHLVAGSWVDPQSSVVLDRTKRPDGPRAVALNTSRHGIARLYVTHASEYAFPRPWPLVRVGPARSGSVDDLVAAVADALIAELPVTPPSTLEQILDDYVKFDEPVFVALQAPAIDSGAMAELRRKFPTVVFFLLIGPSGNIADAASISLLAPIDAKAEETFWSSWTLVRRHLLRDPSVEQPDA